MKAEVSMETGPVEKGSIMGCGVGGAYVTNSTYSLLHRNPTLIALCVAMERKTLSKNVRVCVLIFFPGEQNSLS